MTQIKIVHIFSMKKTIDFASLQELLEIEETLARPEPTAALVKMEPQEQKEIVDLMELPDEMVSQVPEETPDHLALLVKMVLPVKDLLDLL